MTTKTCTCEKPEECLGAKDVPCMPGGKPHCKICGWTLPSLPKDAIIITKRYPGKIKIKVGGSGASGTQEQEKCPGHETVDGNKTFHFGSCPKQEQGWELEVKQSLGRLVLNCHKMVWDEITEFGSRTPQFDAAMEKAQNNIDEVISLVRTISQQSYERGVKEERARLAEKVKGMIKPEGPQLKTDDQNDHYYKGTEDGFNTALTAIISLLNEKP